MKIFVQITRRIIFDMGEYPSRFGKPQPVALNEDGNWDGTHLSKQGIQLSNCNWGEMHRVPCLLPYSPSLSSPPFPSPFHFPCPFPFIQVRDLGGTQ